MLGRLALTTGIAMSLLACGTTAQAAGLHQKKALVGTATCEHALILDYQAIKITTSGIPYTNPDGTLAVGYYTINGQPSFTAAADFQGFAVAVADGKNIVVEKVNGTPVASCSITIKGLIAPPGLR
jgi:hypothetical protein